MVFIITWLLETSRGCLVCKGVIQIQVEWTLQAVVQIPLGTNIYGTLAINDINSL